MTIFNWLNHLLVECLSGCYPSVIGTFLRVDIQLVLGSIRVWLEDAGAGLRGNVDVTGLLCYGVWSRAAVHGSLAHLGEEPGEFLLGLRAKKPSGSGSQCQYIL